MCWIINKGEDDLLRTLKTHLPRAAMMYNVVQLKLSQEPHSEISIDIYQFNSNIRDEGWAAFVRVEGLPQTLVVVFTPNDPSETFLQQLDEAIDWSFPNQFEGLEDKVASYIEKRGRERGEIKLHDPIEMYFVPEEVCNRLAYDLAAAKESFPASNIRVNSLSPNDANTIDRIWPASCPGSLEMIRASIKAVGSAGVRFSGTENDATFALVSWAVALPFGSIHALHTLPEFQGRGFAKLTMLQVAHDVAQRGRIPVVQIFKKNDTSKKVNLKVGFVYSHDINLVHFYPADYSKNNFLQ